MKMNRSVRVRLAGRAGRAASALVFAAVLAAATGLSAGPALAASTWTVSPGGHFTAVSGTAVLTDTSTGASIRCAASSLGGTLRSGTGLSGTDIGDVTAFGLSSCTGLGQTFSTTATDFPWQLNATSYSSVTRGPRSGGIAILNLLGVSEMLNAISCHLWWWGTPPDLTLQYNNSSAALTSLTSPAMRLYDVSGCSGAFNDGDTMSLSVTYTVSPVQFISQSVTTAP
jgi:hypothetical protein